ncbi:MAG: hypothetical protein ABIG44_10530 [Planctomycetota bacterium]
MPPPVAAEPLEASSENRVPPPLKAKASDSPVVHEVSPLAAPVADQPPLEFETDKPRTPRDVSCPGCGANMHAGAVICVICGYNTRTGRRLRTTMENDAPRQRAVSGQAWPRHAPAFQKKEQLSIGLLLSSMPWGWVRLVVVVGSFIAILTYSAVYLMRQDEAKEIREVRERTLKTEHELNRLLAARDSGVQLTDEAIQLLRDRLDQQQGLLFQLQRFHTPPSTNRIVVFAVILAVAALFTPIRRMLEQRQE